MWYVYDYQKCLQTFGGLRMSKSATSWESLTYWMNKHFLFDRCWLFCDFLFFQTISGGRDKGLNPWTVGKGEPLGHSVFRGRGHSSSQVLPGTFSEQQWGWVHPGHTCMPILCLLGFMKEGFQAMTVKPLWNNLADKSEINTEVKSYHLIDSFLFRSNCLQRTVWKRREWICHFTSMAFP
jgi:hypothetical protein